MQKHVFIGSIFIPEKYKFRVCFESPKFYEDDIQPDIQVFPPLLLSNLWNEDHSIEDFV